MDNSRQSCTLALANVVERLLYRCIIGQVDADEIVRRLFAWHVKTYDVVVCPKLMRQARSDVTGCASDQHDRFCYWRVG